MIHPHDAEEQNKLREASKLHIRKAITTWLFTPMSLTNKLFLVFMLNLVISLWIAINLRDRLVERMDKQQSPPVVAAKACACKGRPYPQNGYITTTR